MRRVLLGITIVLLGTAAWATLPDRPSQAAVSAADAEARFLELLDRARDEAGLPPLVVHPELAALARRWSASMAREDAISHARPISEGLDAPWYRLGENVGTGPDPQAVMEAFMASPGHRANVLDPAFTHVGIGVVWDGDRLYTTHRFLQEAQAP